MVWACCMRHNAHMISDDLEFLETLKDMLFMDNVKRIIQNVYFLSILLELWSILFKVLG